MNTNPKTHSNNAFQKHIPKSTLTTCAGTNLTEASIDRVIKNIVLCHCREFVSLFLWNKCMGIQSEAVTVMVVGKIISILVVSF